MHHGLSLHSSAMRVFIASAVTATIAVACGGSGLPTADGSLPGPGPTATTRVTQAESGDMQAGPSCDDGLVPSLAALDRETGLFRWTYCSSDRAWWEIRGATDDIVHATSTMPGGSATENELIAVDAATGAAQWQIPVARQQLGWPPGPFAGGGVVVVEIDGGRVIVGLDASSGAELWRVVDADLGGSAGTSSGPPGWVVAVLANTDDVVVLAVRSGLVGLDRTDGAVLWSSDVLLLDESGVTASRGPAAVDGSSVMVPAASESGGSTLVALDATTGETLWRGPRLDHPTAAEGHVVGYDHSWMQTSQPPADEVLVVDGSTGELLWSRPGMESYGDLWAIGDGVVVVRVWADVGEDVVAYELDSGEQRWRRSSAMSARGEPQLVTDGLVVLLRTDLEVLSTADGTTHWTVPASISPATPMSSVGHNATSILVTFNGLEWGD